jgi:hypothetical protein
MQRLRALATLEPGHVRRGVAACGVLCPHSGLQISFSMVEIPNFARVSQFAQPARGIVAPAPRR